ncbi:hypothetical protein F441_21406 [Phytophthora nicotianae CJ01A1]|uniref:Uncharacterized protein n=2 Tax=Phytophthora nicotianae TaxID=4792 RepID=W2HVV2_PHYNI|nr:hypothetical protein L915_20921 [Phytophthora nicotianae]ETL25327.1 hypothetical protein L916_20804 [Phytophthora nicotianae]ETP01330.1 hypothetical protein F441_21406 [Phytophthora nicotianae CJ01A1]
MYLTDLSLFCLSKPVIWPESNSQDVAELASPFVAMVFMTETKDCERPLSEKENYRRAQQAFGKISGELSLFPDEGFESAISQLTPGGITCATAMRKWLLRTKTRTTKRSMITTTSQVQMVVLLVAVYLKIRTAITEDVLDLSHLTLMTTRSFPLLKLPPPNR